MSVEDQRTAEGSGIIVTAPGPNEIAPVDVRCGRTMIACRARPTRWSAPSTASSDSWT